MSGKKQQAKNKKGGNQVSFTGFWNRYRSPIIITFVCFAVYSNSLFNSYNLDDELVTRKHPLTSQGIRAIPEIFSSPYYSDDMGYAYDYRPLVHISFALEHQFFGEHAAVSHLVNVLLYALLCVVLFFVLRSVFGVSDLFSICTALVFALHPLHTEVVCSIKNRDEILCLLFGLLATLSTSYVFERRYLWLLTSALFYTGSVMSKYTGVSFSLFIPLIMITMSQASIKEIIWVGILYAIPTFLFHQQPLVSSKLIFTFGLFFIPLLFFFPLRKVSTLCNDIVRSLLKKTLSRAFETKSHFKKVVFEVAYGDIKEASVSSQTTDSFKDLSYALIIFVCITLFAFFINRSVVLPVWIGITCTLYILTRSHRYRLIALISFVLGVVLIEHPLPSIADNNPLPTLVSVLLLLALNPEKVVNYSRFVLIALITLLVANTSIQLFLIEDIGAIFPLGGLIFAWMSHKVHANFKRIGLFVFVGLSLIQGILLVFRLSEFSGYRAAFDFLTFCSILTTLFILTNNNRSIALDKIWISLVTLAVLFYSQHIPEPRVNLQKTLISIPQKLDLKYSTEHVDYSPTTENNQPPLTFEIFSKPSDRQIAYVESPVTLYDDFETRVASATIVALKYFRKLFVPYPMAFYYGYKEFEPENLQSPNAIVGLLIHVLLAIAFIYALITEQKTLAVGLLIYLVSAAAVSGFLQPIAGVFADRFALIPSLGFSICITWLLFRIFKTSEFDESLTYQKIKPALKYTLVFIFVIYGSLTFARNFDWKDDLTLMRKDIKVVDKSAQAHNLLAIHLVNAAFAANDLTEQQRLREEALHHLKKAQEIYPPFFNVSYDIARLYILLNKPDSALQAYENTIALDSTFSDSHLNAGEILFSFKRYEEAVPYFAYVIKDRPNEYLGYDKLSYLYFSMKEYQKSVVVNKAAIQKLPNLIDPYINIGRTFIAAGQNDSALYYLQIARNMDPANQLIIDLQASVGK